MIKVKNLTAEEIQEKIKTIRAYVKNKSISHWKDFALERYIFEAPVTEKEMEDSMNCWFCNGIGKYIQSATLVYSSYEGYLGIIPNDLGDEESYFNFIEISTDPENNQDKYNQEILEFWKQLQEKVLGRIETVMPTWKEKTEKK